MFTKGDKIIMGILITSVGGLVLYLIICLVLWLNSESFNRTLVDMKSELTGGIEREINVYTADGELIKHFEGKIDIGEEHDGAVKFDFEGKRYIYYNCFVETIGEIENE